MPKMKTNKVLLSVLRKLLVVLSTSTLQNVTS